MRMLDGHVGDLILLTFAILALGCYTLTVMTGHADQTLGNIAIGGSAALAGYMAKRIMGGQTTNVVDTANVTNEAPAENGREKKEPVSLDAL